MGKRLTILHLIDSIAQGGAETLLAQTIGELKGYNHVLVYLESSSDNIDALNQQAVVHNLDVQNNLSIPLAVFRLRRLIKKYHVDIVHAHLWKSVFIARLGTPNNVRLLFTLHSIMSRDAYTSRLRLLLDKVFYNKRQEAIAVSSAVQEDFSKHLNAKGPQHVLHNFVDDKYFSLQRKNEANRQFRMVAVGNLKEAKNYPFLLEALSHVKNIDFTLDIYGDGPQKEMLQNLIKTKSISARLMGKERQVENVLPHYDLFVMASSHEGYGLALTEAMAAGLPVLVSDIAAFKEVAGDAACYFSSNNVDSFITQLTMIFEHHKQGTLNAFEEKSRARAREIACKEKYFQKLEAIYNR